MDVLVIVLVTFLWASVLLIASVVKIHPVFFVFLRLLFSLIVVLPLGLRVKEKRLSFGAMVSGAFLSLNWIFLFMAVRIIGPSSADFIYYTAPVISLVLGKIFGEPIPVLSWMSVFVSFTGVGLIYKFSRVDLVGTFYAFLGALFYGSVVVLGKRISKKMDPYLFTMEQMISALIITFFFSLPYIEPLSLKDTLLSLTAGVMNTGVALILWWKTLKRVNLRLASVLTYLDPFFALLLSVLVLGQKLTTWNLLGAILITIGGAMGILQERGR